ncbi:DUF3817 domain-containing protein [Nocardioides montaniterrae]
MIKLFAAYRILAIVVGIFLLVDFVWTCAMMKSFSIAAFQTAGDPIWFLWMLHGYFYIAYIAVVLVFVRRAGYSPLTFVLMILGGLVPLLMFYVEHRVNLRFKAEHPELFAAPVAA